MAVLAVRIDNLFVYFNFTLSFSPAGVPFYWMLIYS